MSITKKLTASQESAFKITGGIYLPETLLWVLSLFLLINALYNSVCKYHFTEKYKREQPNIKLAICQIGAVSLSS
jgi:uncharacterized membrane protein